VRKVKSETRLSKIKNVLKYRQPNLTVVLENIHDRHNVSAIIRSCDSVGIKKIVLLYHIEKFPKLSKHSSASSSKWVEQERFKDVDECFRKLKSEGFKVFGSKVALSAKTIYDIDFTQKTALLFGNEHRGISEEAESLCDDFFYIPMFGMTQSLNVSVATAVALYEAYRQRNIKGMYDELQMTNNEYETMIDEWCEIK